MQVHSSIRECFEAACADLQKTIQSAVRTLLEDKHLYQSVVVEADKAVGAHRLKVASEEAIRVRHFADVKNWAWYAEEVSTQFGRPGDDAFADQSLQWTAPSIRSYCSTCDRREPFNLASALNLFNRASGHVGGVVTAAGKTEVFSMSYICQGCKGPPEVFTIRRVGPKLTLCGRAPMEHVEVPRTIPASISRFFSGAVIAHQSGQTLAGLFLLRTLCEQWARLFASASDRADAALDAYMDGLPVDFKGRFPSLRTMYGELSEAIHSAYADTALFQATAQAITEHFEARKLYKLSDATPQVIRA
ncbi:hypothetical protein C7T35_23950 [Variovorax sp. WS11]|uniref:hypothetical protein n=1 Tax=Variovorax sp. WS11 TaxID=1105204 RepID=UPI000D0E11CE|nr:hypothetical protein [Variovorax sp. WS11]NDZ11457.1 hypothetical protein [Variovorax sp. WS11]PSL82096.1 hypothetical protein C7T35_23950 [Variovorax sp. WS11]